MRLFYIWSIPILWILWYLYWRISAAHVKAVVRSESVGSRALHIVPLWIAGLLIWISPRHLHAHTWWLERVIRADLVNFYCALSLVVAGLGFGIWARVVLGHNWSGTVTVKQDHELIQAGPYRWVRHPIYTGLLLALLGSAIARGTPAGLLGVLIAFGALWRKLRLEERFMNDTFGERYQAYRARTRTLIPFLL